MNFQFCRCLNVYKQRFLMVLVKRKMLKHSINHIMNKKVMDRYYRLPLPCNKVLATYVWIDGSNINMRCKDRILSFVPCMPEGVPKWFFDGSSCGIADTANSDTALNPVAIYRDPFRMDPHIMILNDVYMGDTMKPAKTNNRFKCNELCKKYADQDPWFGLEQEYTMFDNDGWGLGWPKGGGFPTFKYEFSYCGVGAKYIAGRDLVEAHTRASLFAGCDFEGTNAEVMLCTWEWQIGISHGIKAADDMWISRYIMARIGEEFGVTISYNNKPAGMLHPGIGMHHNFSVKKMRTAPGGYKFIEECIKRLEKNHMKHMKHYQIDLASNKMRLSGKFETAPYDKFSWGIANRKASIRLGRGIKKRDKGFLEDRRPGGDADPYAVCALLMETCLEGASSGGGGPVCKKN